MARRPPKREQAPHDATPLNDNQLAFLDRYLATFPRNGRRAYADVYGCKLSTAAVEASRLLKDPRIIAEIERRESPAAGRFKLAADRVRREIAAVAFSDVRHYTIAKDGAVALADGAPEDAIRAVRSIRVKRRRIPRGANLEPIEEVETEVKLWDKPAALRMAGQVRGLFVKRAPVGPDGKPVPPPPAGPATVEIVFVESEDGKPVAKAKPAKPAKRAK
jgi:phage terminase small subunit